MADQKTQGGTHEQHVKAGQQSHKNTSGSSSHEEHGSGESGGKSSGTSTQGGTHEQHVNAGKQSHKNS